MVVPRLRPMRRFRPRFARRYGWYIHRQWGEDTHTTRTYDTEVQLAVSTALLADLPSVAEDILDSLTLDCIYSAFDAAGFPTNQLIAFFSTLNAAYPMDELRRLPRRVLIRMVEPFGSVPLVPRARAVLRLTHKRGGQVIRGPYEYWVVFNVHDCSYVFDYDIGSGRPGRPRIPGQKTLGEFT